MNAQPPIERTGLSDAIRAAGGKTALVRLLNACGHHLGSHNTIAQWELRGQIPAHFCPDIERVTGVMCEWLRPDVPWGVVRSSKHINARTSPAAKTAAKSPAAPV